jgi:hypothetical protein
LVLAQLLQGGRYIQAKLLKAARHLLAKFTGTGRLPDRRIAQLGIDAALKGARLGAQAFAQALECLEHRLLEGARTIRQFLAHRASLFLSALPDEAGLRAHNGGKLLYWYGLARAQERQKRKKSRDSRKTRGNHYPKRRVDHIAKAPEAWLLPYCSGQSHDRIPGPRQAKRVSQKQSSRFCEKTREQTFIESGKRSLRENKEI